LNFVRYLILTAGLSTAVAAADLKSLIEAERAFARLSVEKGIKGAFLANLAPDSIVFRRRCPSPAGRPTSS
jgi:hypothetical protein